MKNGKLRKNRERNLKRLSFSAAAPLEITFHSTKIKKRLFYFIFPEALNCISHNKRLPWPFFFRELIKSLNYSLVDF